MAKSGRFYTAKRASLDYVETKKTTIKPILGHAATYKMRGDGQWGTHYPSIYEALMVSEGSYKIEIRNKTIELGPGQGIVLRPTDMHRDICIKGSTLHSLTFNFSYLWGDQNDAIKLFLPNTTPDLQRFRIDTGRIDAIFKEVQADTDISGPAAQFHHCQLMSVYYEILSKLPQKALSEDFILVTKEDQFEARLHEYFLKNMKNTITVDDIASALYMSRSSLAHKCKELLGEPATQILRNMRLQSAKLLLEGSDMSIKQVSIEVGFKDPFHFSKCYKNLFGISPNQVRA